MKKSLRKTINHLSQYIGVRIIRTQLSIYKDGRKDYSYTQGSIILTGFTKDGRIKYRHIERHDLRLFGKEEYTLPVEMTDRNWISYRKALKAKNHSLNQWRGKQIKRTAPTKFGDKTFMDADMYSDFPILIAASKHHVLVEVTNIFQGKIRYLLGCKYVDGNWELAE